MWSLNDMNIYPAFYFFIYFNIYLITACLQRHTQWYVINLPRQPILFPDIWRWKPKWIKSAMRCNTSPHDLGHLSVQGRESCLPHCQRSTKPNFHLIPRTSPGRRTYRFTSLESKVSCSTKKYNHNNSLVVTIIHAYFASWIY